MSYSLKDKIKMYLDDCGDRWVPSYDLEKVNTKYGWIGSSGTRRARELAEAGEIERKLIGKFVNYRKKQVWTPPVESNVNQPMIVTPLF